MNAQDKGGLIPLHNAASYGVSSFMLAFKMSEVFSENQYYNAREI